MKEVKIIKSLFLLICITSVLGSQNIKQNLDMPFYTKHQFTIYLPQNWHEIPKDILNLASKIAQQKYNLATQSKYNYGYQINTNKEWFDFPYILVQVKKGRIPENEFKNTTQIKKNF